MKFFGVPVKSFNIEITNRCVLACPECPRTGNPWATEDPRDLPVPLLRKVFPIESREQFEGLRVNLCGAHGDCIYHPGFHDALGHLKAAGLTVNVETNGSHRKPSWWERTCEILGPEDTLTFSVDGLADSNHIYRVNARWPDIERAMRQCAPAARVVWKFIVFRHNEHQVDAAAALGREIGVDEIIFKRSGRFRADDPLAPENDDYIGSVTRNRRRIQELVDGGVDAQTFDREVAIRPRCRHGKDLAITARGYFFPCTSCESADTETWFHRNRDHFDLNERSIAEILASDKWTELESKWNRASSVPQACLYYCGVHTDYDEQYRSESRSDRPYKPEDSLPVRLAAERR